MSANAACVPVGKHIRQSHAFTDAFAEHLKMQVVVATTSGSICRLTVMVLDVGSMTKQSELCMPGHLNTKAFEPTALTIFVQVVATGSLLLARLRLYSMTAKATETAEQLVKGHMVGAPQLSMRQTSELITTLGVRLTDLAEELVQSDDPAPPANAKGLAADQPGMPTAQQ